MEDITDEMREWFISWYEELGYFDVYPATEAGGSILVATGQTRTPEEYAKELLAKKKADQKGKLKTKEILEKKEATKREVIKEKEKAWRMPNSQVLSYMHEAIDDFIKNWSHRDEIVDNHKTIHFDLINDELCHKLQLEMRELVDEIMRLELNKLVQAVKKDHAGNKEILDMPKIKKGQYTLNRKLVFY